MSRWRRSETFASRCVLGAMLAGVLVLAGSAGQAHAAGATIWPYASTLTPSGLSSGVEIAINQTTGNLLVVDRGNKAILQMDESGTPVPFTHPALAGATALDNGNVPGGTAWIGDTTDVAVDNSGTATQGNIYVVIPEWDPMAVVWNYRLLAFKSSGEPLYQITRPGLGCGLGVAPDGNVWVGTDTEMHEFTPAGAPAGPGFALPSDLLGLDHACESEFDAAGNMFIFFRGNGRAVRRSPTGVYRVLSTNSVGMAVDAATGNVLTSKYREGAYGIDQIGPDGELEEVTGVGNLSHPGSLALSRDGRMLFLLWSDLNLVQTELQVFGPAVRRPEADAAASVGTTSAALTGVVRPGGEATTYQFEYGTTKSLSSVTPSAPVDAGSGTGPVTASTSVSGLKPQTFYYYRLKATVGGTTVYSKVRSLRTGGPAATVSGVRDLGPSSGTFSGSVDSFDLGAASFHFLVEAVGSPFSAVSAELPVSAGSGPRQVSASVTGLPPGQRFTVRLLATAGGVTEASASVSFQTPELGVPAPAPLPSSNPSPYGCGAPVLKAPTARAREGDVVTLAGSDLGVGGTVVVGGVRVTAPRWSSTAVSFVVPPVGVGKALVSVNCGRASNSVELSVVTTSSNVFRLGAGAVKGSSAAVAVALPGAGTVVSSGKYLAKSTVKIKKAGSVSVQVRLTAAGRRALAKARSGALKVTAQVRYTPTGGAGRTLSTSITFKRGGSR